MDLTDNISNNNDLMEVEPETEVVGKFNVEVASSLIHSNTQTILNSLCSVNRIYTN